MRSVGGLRFYLELQDLKLSIFKSFVIFFCAIEETFHFLHERIMESIDIFLSD
jgi:hypothetical protein